MNERASWSVAFTFALIVAVVVLLIDRSGLSAEITKAEEQAGQLRNEADSLRDLALIYRWEADSLHRIADKLRKQGDALVNDAQDNTWRNNERRNLSTADAARLKRIILWRNDRPR